MPEQKTLNIRIHGCPSCSLGSISSWNTPWVAFMAILLLKSTTEPKCPTASPFRSPWILQTHWLTWDAQLLARSLDASPGELAHNVFSTCTAQWKCLGDMRATFLARRFYSNHMPSEVSLSPVLFQPWLGHPISSSSLAGVMQHRHFLPQPSLPLQFLQVEISSTPAPCRQIPSCFHSGVNRKRRRSHT